MRKIIVLFLALMISGVLAVPAYALEAFEITAFDIKMEVGSDNCYQITETIDLEYSEQMRGFIRTLPIKSYKGKSVKIKDVQVSSHKFSKLVVSGNMEIKIGDPSVYAANTEQYVISYYYGIGDDGLTDMDELYFNLIGPEWDCYINNVTFSISMPDAFDDGKLNFTYGADGSTKNDQVTWSVADRTINGNLEVALAPGEALTVALPLPQGYFDNVKTVQDSIPGMIILLPLFFGCVGFVLWLFLGKKKRIFPTVEFYPPKELTSADVGYIIDGRVDSFDVTSLILYWADKGYLTITEQVDKKTFGTKKSFLFTKICDPAASARTYEKQMFKILFNLGSGTSVTTEKLAGSFYKTAKSTKKAIINSFESITKMRIFEASNKICKRMLLLLAYLSLLPFTYILAWENIEDSVLEILLIALPVSLFPLFLLFSRLICLSHENRFPKNGVVQR